MTNIIRQFRPSIKAFVANNHSYWHFALIEPKQRHQMGFPLDALRYDKAYFFKRSDTEEVQSYFEKPMELSGSKITVVRTFYRKKILDVWTPDLWWGWILEPQPQRTMKLQYQLKHMHHAVAKPCQSNDAYKRPQPQTFPLSLMQLEHAWPESEVMSHRIMSALQPGVAIKNDAIVLTKRFPSKESTARTWQYDAWENVGWDLQPVSDIDVPNYG